MEIVQFLWPHKQTGIFTRKAENEWPDDNTCAESSLIKGPSQNFTEAQQKEQN